MALIYFAVPTKLQLAPSWVLLILTFVLIVPLIWLNYKGNYRTAHNIGFMLSGLQTIFLIGGLALLIFHLPRHGESGIQLLQSAATLFPSNILIFALWYWRIDAGGPYAREIAGSHVAGEFLFPQMTMDIETRKQCGQDDWTPGFIDYLFLAFNTSTALSPADTGALTRLAKVMMMVQASISVTILVLLVGRAVNVL